MGEKCNADMTSSILEAGRECVMMHNVEEKMWPSSQFSNIESLKNMTNTKEKFNKTKSINKTDVLKLFICALDKLQGSLGGPARTSTGRPSSTRVVMSVRPVGSTPSLSSVSLLSNNLQSM